MYFSTRINSPIARRGFLVAFLLAAVAGRAQQSQGYDLSQASLEDLMNLQVTSVSKKEQNLSKAGAAIFVITQDDIRRSGATNIPDVLRMAPGVDVAQVDSNRWAISIRGFNNSYADKVLVLVDGRSVYDPSFSGVFWDIVDVPLEDIERIEVIRGPGGTVWGANAVNGVINIITKSAQATQGGLISAGGGSHDRGDSLFQYGGQAGQSGSYRVFARYFDIGNAILPNGQPAADGWQAGHAGFRSDWSLWPRDTFTVQGDFLQTSESQTINTLFTNALPQMETITDPISAKAANLLARWNHTLEGGSQMSLQIYDNYSRHVEEGFLNRNQTADVDFQHHIALGSRNDVVWGLDGRFIASYYGTGYAITVLPNHRRDHLLSGFIQDELKITNALSLTVGSKVEHNDFTGVEYEPSAQLLWAPTNKQSVWFSAARAIRQPSAIDVGLQDDLFNLPYGPTVAIVKILGNPGIRAEQLRDFEAGYRTQLNKNVSLDIAAFGSLYRDLESIALQNPYEVSQTVPYLVLPYLYGNSASAGSYGAEFSANWRVNRHWRISSSYSYFHMNLNAAPSSVESPPGQSPDHQFQVHSLLDLPHHFEWDNTIAYVSHLPVGNIPACTRLDSRLGWRVSEFVELNLVGQNLLTPHHAEFSITGYPTIHTLVERSVFGSIRWHF